MIDDPRIERLARALLLRSPAAQPREPGMVEAAVALVVRPRDALELLLIQRSVRASDPWSGHMALPGGRRAHDDADLLATALRETREETAVDAARTGRHLGALDDVSPRARQLPRIVISPFVVAVPPATEATPDPREVDAAIWVPLDALRDEAAAGELVLELETSRRAFPSLRYREHVIWGLTHRILEQFMAVAAESGV